MKTPVYSIFIDDKDITDNFSKRLISMQITENRGLEADILSLELDDSDGLLTLPERGVNIKISLGWKNDSTILQNTFTIDECEHTGAPDKLSIQGKSANMRDTLNIKRENSYTRTTFGEIIKLVANRHNLEFKIDSELEKIAIEHIDQTNESDASFLTRLSNDLDAITMLKNGILLILKSGASRTVSGEIIPTSKITRQSGDSHRFMVADRNAYTGVKAYWLDYKTSTKHQTIIKKDGASYENDNVLVGAEGNIKTMRHTYANKQNAYRAAKNEWLKLQRGAAQFSISLAEGRPDLFAEMPIEVSGFKKEIDSTLWTVTRCIHNLDGSSGFTTSIELEIKISEEKAEDETNIAGDL